MAKFRFPGKALKLNTRKRVRFRGSHAANTPEELYTRRIRRGLDLFTQIFGDSDEDDEEFEGFTSILPEPRDVKGKKKIVGSPRKKKLPPLRLEEACSALEEEGLVTRRKVSAVEMAIKEVQEKPDVSKNVPVVTRRRVGVGDTTSGKEMTGSSKDVSTRQRISAVEIATKEVPEGSENKDLPIVTRRRVSVIETKEGAERNKDPPVVTRRRGHSLEGIVKDTEQPENVPLNEEKLSGGQELPQSVGSENIENVITPEKSTKESDLTLRESKVVVMAPGQMVRKTARRVSRPSTVKTALAKKLLARAKAKRTVNSLPVVGEKSPKRFVLPSMSVRSSRIIKPNKRLFADITDMCTASSSLETVGEGTELENIPNKRLVKLTRKGRSSHTQFLSLPRSRAQSTDSLSSSEGGGGRDRMRRTISLYTESITGPSKAQVGRPPKRLLRRMEPPQPEIEAEVPDSPQRCDPKESKVMEKIGKLLRSPWDNRLKQSGKGGRGEEEGLPSAFSSSAMSATALSRNILRKARLNLNKTTLQKIRNPVSLQRLIPASDQGVEGKCAVCDTEDGNFRKFGVVLCDKCSSFISNSSDGSREVYECKDKVECQVQEDVEGRCNACWLGRILHVCTMPNLLHDRLRKRLPNILKEQIPTSLARCMSGNTAPSASEKDADLTTHTKRLPLDPGGGGAFGSVMDLPGGWKRKTGPEVIVISPSGEKFKSMQKLEEFLKKQGITTDARVLFGNSSPAVVRSNEAKSRSSQATNNSSRGKVVMTTLPGGWVRRIKWRSAGDRFDTYVYSPDGRTFRSRRELSAYFQLIGKVDDIHKYFPVVTGHSDASIPSSSDTTGSSSTERLSSSEPCSEISSDDKSPEASECEAEPSRSRGRKLSRTGKEKMKVPRIKPNKVKNHKEGHHRSKSVSSLKNVESVQKAEVQMEVDTAADTKAVEKKYKKPKIIVRSRSLSLGRKKADASLTDTTESESENKNSGKGFAKAFSKRLKNKPKVAVHLASPSDTGTNTSNESGDKTTPALEPKGETEVSEVQKPDTAEDRAHVFIKPEAVSLEKPSEQRKIVLKIQKKNIENVDRRHRYRNKEEKRRKTSCFEVAGSLSEEQVAQSGAESVQNMTAEKVLAQLSSTSKSSEEGKEKVFSNSSDDLDREMIDGESDIPVGPDISDDSKFSSPMVSESEPTQETIEVPEAKPKSKPKKPSNYQTSHFGGGWSRKIKWNEKGEGKIALLHSPDGQTFRSRIELLAYFKKAGKSKGNLDFYFPPVLKREDYGEVLEKKKSPSEVTMALGTSTSSQSSEVSDFTDSEVPKTSEESCISGEEGTKRRISRIVKCYRKGSSLKSISESGVEDSQITSGKSNQLEETWKHAKSGRKELFVTIPDSKQSVKSESEEIDGTLPEAVGPRVKHVCRSQAQVLGIPRAVFPSPGKEDDKPPMKVMVPSSKSDKKRKIVTVTTTASGKVLRKTQWCNKCPGCTTPNCRKCVNCLDMKKYGGPGTKKKPCVMRKCHNPRLSIKSAINQEGTTKIPVHISTSTTLPTSKEVRKVPPAVIKTQEEKTMTTETSSDLVLKSSFQQEKAVFVPRQMTRSQPDQKDRGDIAAGKQFVPGTLVNIDYWQGYDADEMMLTGYPVITASSQNPQILCFRCGSLGKEQLLYCAWCCEGVHPYCLEDGEGPESEVEEAFWICRRCAVCYVCGAPGADSLLRCSDCRNYYHMECLGPSAHSTCQPPPDRPWEAESMALLAESWPKQSAIFDAGGGEAKSVLGDIVMHTDLDAVKDMDEDAEDEDLEPDIFFLPVGEEVEEKESSMFEREDSLSGDELEDSFCLEDSIIEVFRDIDLYKPEPSPTANIRGEEVATMRDDEYLYLGYKKIYEYPTNRIEMSYFRLLQIIHNELFATHGYPTWREMLRNGLVADRSSGSMSGSDTETASEGMSESEESDLDWDDIFEIRRHEAAEELKEREDKRREEERRQREIEREKARIERQKEMEREAKEKELSQGKEKDSFTPKMKILGSDKVASPQELAKKHLFKKKRKCGRPPGSLNKPKYGDEDFVVFDDYDEECQDEQGITPRRKRLKQPRSWEEFDELFARSGLVSDAPAGGSKEVRIRKRKVVYSDNGIIGMRHEKFKLRAKRQKLGLVSSKKFKNLKDVSRSKILKFKDKIMRRPGRPPKIKPEKRELYDVEEKIQPKKKKQNVRDNFEYSGKKSGSKPNGINREIPGETKGEGNEAVNRNSSSGNKCSEDGSDENSTKDQIESGLLETPTNQSGKKGRPEEENSDKENLPGVDAASKLKEAETVISQKTHINGLEEAGTSTCTQSAEGVEEETKQGKNEAKCLDLSVANLPKLPEKRARRSKCVRCTRCTSCGSPNVAQWLEIPCKSGLLSLSSGVTPLTIDLALCARCITLRERGNFCPLCNGCYEDDDYDSRMMECGRCGEWIHAHCEGLNNERYQILSFLPDTVEYVCRNCVTESTSAWLDAVSSELMAGCEAVLQALIASRCAKHLVKREASSKVSSSGGLTPLPCLPEVGTSVQARIDDALVEKVEDLDTLLPVTGTNTVAMESHSTTTSAESNSREIPPLSGSNACVSMTTMPAVTADSYISSTPEATSSSSEVSHVVSVDDLGAGAPQASSKSDDCADKNFTASLCSVNVNRTDIPQEVAGEFSKQSGEQMACFSDNQSDIVAANKSTGKSGCITVAKDKSDLKGKSSKEKNIDDQKSVPRRQTRSSSGGAGLLVPIGSMSTAADPIKLKECSVRLEDICKAKSPSSSPLKTQLCEQENMPIVEEKKSEEPSHSQEPLVEDKIAKNDERAPDSLKSLEEKELERVTHDALQGILALKDTDVSCTQVDGPNDETTATARVIRNLFFEDRNQMMPDTTSLLESKSEVDDKNLAHVETQLISPKDKITKDIDDDCVSSEESSYCDTDTEIESIQDDPEEPRDLISVKEKLRERKYDSVLQFHFDMLRVIENGRHLNRSQTRNVQVTYTKHMKECFPWFDVKTANVFELVDKQRPFPLPHWDHSYAYRPLISGTRIFSVRDVPLYRKRSTSPAKGAQISLPDLRKCVLCSREGDDEPNAAGRLLYLGQNEWMHVNCGLWSSEVYEEVDGGLQNIYVAVSRGRLIKCSACNERGATVGCCHKSCQATYHFLCARKACCQFMEDKRIFCPLHESTSNGEEKTDDFKVSRCVYVDMDSEKKKWKQVPGNRVNIILGSLTIKNLGRIVPESDSSEALIPLDFICSRVYWSTVDPTKKVTYTCRTKRVVPSFDDLTLVGDAAFHKTIDHELGEEAVSKEMAAVRKWFKQLEERKVEKKSRETNIIPPHLCPLYRSIREREQETRVVEKVLRCHTPPAIVELDVRQCIDDIIDRVSRSVEEESLLLDTDLPAIVSADDNELISMVLNDLDACDSITLQSTPSTSGRPSPLDIDFLSTCDHMMDSGKVSHSGNLTQEAQETECDPRGMMEAASLSPGLHPTLTTGIDPIHEAYQVESPNADIKEPIIETIAPPSVQDLGSVPSSSASLQNITNSNSQNMSTNSNRSSSDSNTTSSCSTCSSESKCGSTSSSNSSSSSSSSCSTTEEGSSPERCPAGAMSTSSSPESSSRVISDNSVSNDSNNGSTDSNSGSESSSQSASGSNQSPSAVASGKTNSLKQICRVLPMPSTNSRRSSSASEHSDAIGHAGQNHSPPASNQSPRNSDENEGNTGTGRGNERKKICMKRNYKTVIKKYPLRSGMRKSKPYETVQIEINETIEIPGGEGSGMVRKSLKRKWSGILDSEEEEDNNQKETAVDPEGQDETTNRASDGENSKENSVSKKVLKFSDDNNDITVSIVNNNNLCEFSKSRVHKYRHKTVLQLDGAADGSSSSAEMSESQDEGTGEERRRLQEQEDPQTPPLHSALAMRIKEQSLARSSPGEEGPYKCGKCKRLYRTKESYQKHIETCTFEVDSSSTSEDDEYEDDAHSEEEEGSIPTALPQLQEETPEVGQEHGLLQSICEREEFPSVHQQSINNATQPSLDLSSSTSITQAAVMEIPTQAVEDPKHSEAVDLDSQPRTSLEEPPVKKPRLEVTLPRQHGVHRQVRTAIKKCPSNAEDVELLQVVRGPPPPGSDVFVPPPVSPVKFSPVVKKSASPRRYTNVRLLRGSRGYQYRRAAPQLPASHDHYQGTNPGVQMTPSAAPAPIQVAMHPMTTTSGQNLAQGALAAFQQFPGQSSQYPGTAQLTSPVTHLTSAVQVTPQVTSQVAPQVSPQVNPQVLTMVSAPSVAVPQGYTLQYVGSFRDGEVAAGSGGLVTYPTAPVVVPQPQLVMTPQQSSVVVPQVVNTNITYTFTAPETLVINQPTMVPGMQSVQYLQQQQQQQQQQQPQVMPHPEQQVGAVMQYNQAGVSPQQVPVSHIHTGQVHTSCMPYSDIQGSPICMQPHAQTAIVTRELSFTGGGSKQLQPPQCIGSSQNRSTHGASVNLPITSSCSGPMPRHRPQASVAPQVIQPQSVLTTSSSDINVPEIQGHSRLPFSDRPLTGVVRTVATVAPAVITSTTVVSLSSCSSATRLTSMDTSPKVATVRPRPTYSYRDAMREKQLERQKQRQEVLQLDRVNVPDAHHDFMKEREGVESVISDSETDSETETTGHDAEKEKEDRLETQSYKLVLRKDSSTSTGFNVLPISGPTTPLPSPEVKELRIKAKVSVGPKRKKAKSRDPEKDLIIVNKDTSSDLYVNEQLPNFSVNPMHSPADDPAMFDRPKACSAEPYIVFELTSEDGFHVESRHIAEVWQKVFDAVAAARASMKMDPKIPHNIQQQATPGDSMSGLHMLGLTHNAVQYLLEQLPGAKDCHRYSFQFHRRPQEEGAVEENPTGCARTESFKTRSPYDIFSWLASKHRRMPERSLVQQEEIQLSTTRRATSLELPMAMRYRHLRETAREAVGVFRSSIHGRGLFCKRDIDAGEMVIEYAGQVIRSSLCDMREKDYESKGIGCYMFRIDDDTVIDATMHGNAARFINHSCDPNCYSRVVDILGKKHIIIFALRRILRGEELTYDYKFPIEEDKIPCTCGTRRCRKYLN